MDVHAINEQFHFPHPGGVHVYPIFNHIEGPMLGSHWHEELEIVYTIYGCNEHIINGEHLQVSPGQVIVVNSDFVHSIIPEVVPPENAVLKAVVLIISQNFLDAAFPQYREIWFTNQDRTATEEMDRIFQELLLYTDSAADTTEDWTGKMLHRNALVLELLSLLSQTRTIQRADTDLIAHTKYVDEIKKIIAYIEEHYAEHLTRQEMAEAFYLSPNYFSSYFRKHVGIPFTQYLTEYRLGKAIDLLLTTDHSVGRIAETCGFSDDRSLIVAFRKKFATTPLQYRKEHSNL